MQCTVHEKLSGNMHTLKSKLFKNCVQSSRLLPPMHSTRGRHGLGQEQSMTGSPKKTVFITCSTVVLQFIGDKPFLWSKAKFNAL